ncbi:MAG: oxidoreductase [Halobacteriovorax sp.]|nr:oxidoreductase [Halobacteriovorax sp.]
MSKLRVALIGYGLSGKSFHSPLIKACPELVIAAVVSSRVDEIKKDLPQASIVSFEQALELSDLVVITTPHQLHFEQAKAALSAGKHVVVEKPFTASTAEAQELFKIANDKKLILKVFFNRRFDADFLTLKTLIQSGELGEIKTIESHFDRFRPTPKENAWREKAGAQSGIWWDLGPHLIDQALALFGKPQDIHYDIGKQRSGEADDFFDVTLKYDKGLRFHLRASCIVKDFGFRFRVHGTKGSVVFKKLDVQEEQLRGGKSPLDSDFGLYPKDAVEASQGVSVELKAGSYLKFYRELITSISSEINLGDDQAAVINGTQILNLDFV